MTWQRTCEVVGYRPQTERSLTFALSPVDAVLAFLDRGLVPECVVADGVQVDIVGFDEGDGEPIFAGDEYSVYDDVYLLGRRGEWGKWLVGERDKPAELVDGVEKV